MKIEILDFSGMAPVLNPRILPDRLAQRALNCTVESHKVVPRKEWQSWEDYRDDTITTAEDEHFTLVDGVLYEDGEPVAIDKPSSPPVVELQKFWDMLGTETEDTPGAGEGGVITPGETESGTVTKFRLRHHWGFAINGQTREIESSSVSFDEETQRYKVLFHYAGDSTNADMYAAVMPSDELEILYNNEVLSYPNPAAPITILYEDGVYATLYFEEVILESIPYTPPGQYTAKLDAQNITVYVRVVKKKTSRTYAYAYVDSNNRIGPSSDVSETIEFTEGDTVKITFPEMKYEKAYLYRTGGSVTNADYYFVGEINRGDNPEGNPPPSTVGGGGTGGAVYLDEVKEYLLQEKMPRNENPPEGLKFLNIVNGALVAAKDNIICFSEPFIENNWQTAWQYKCQDAIIGISISGSSVIVLTEGDPVILRGSHPQSMMMSKITTGYTCVSSDSVTSDGATTYYAAEAGLVAISANGHTEIITKSFFSREQWKALIPSSMKCYHDKLSIYMFFESKTFVIDLLPSGPVLIELETPGTVQWNTKIFQFDRPEALRFVRITTVSGHGSAIIKAGEKELAVNSVPPNSRPARLPNIYSRDWAVEVTSDTAILGIELATSAVEIN